MALDTAGNLYIADTMNMVIRKVAAGSGIISTVAGNGGSGFSGDGGLATAATLSGPQDVALDGAGNLYIADHWNHRIRKVTAGSGIISTIAGNGAGGFSGDGGPATAATLSNPVGVALDAAGNLYIVDDSDLRIRRVAAGSGIISTVAGGGSNDGDGGPATAARLFSPEGVALDAAGNLYIANWWQCRISKVDSRSGIISTVAGNGTPGFSGDGGAATAASLRYPVGVALDGAGNLYIADQDNNRIRRVDAGSGIISTIAGTGTGGIDGSGFSDGGFSGDGGPATAASLFYPSGVALDAAGNLYIADYYNNRIRKVAAGSGIISTVAGNGALVFVGDGGPATASGLKEPQCVALDAAGNLYIADTMNMVIRRVAAGSGMISTVAGGSAVPGFSGDGGPATAAALNMPSGVALDAAGNLYIVDWQNNRIRKVAAGSGIISTVAGSGDYGPAHIPGGFSGDGGPATAATLSQPVGVALDAAGSLYIADQNNQRIRKVAAGSGIISTVAGSGDFVYPPVGFPGFLPGFSGDGGPATAARLSLPRGVALDAAGNLFIADSGNNRIRKVDAGSGIISTVAGNGTPGFSGDGGPLTAATLNWPTGVAFDGAGNLYIADALNERIRKVAAGSGIISTVAGNGIESFSGDGGAATAATLSFPEGTPAVDASGNLFIADTNGSRIRAVFACVTVPSPNLQQPANASSSVPTSPRLAWSPAKGAFHYDVYLDTANPPQNMNNLGATDITAPTYSPANLDPLTQYYWKVVAKGDPFCTPFSTAASEVFSFTTTGSCGAPGPLTGAVSTSGNSATITWQPSARASSYDLYLGTTNPPQFYASNLTSTSQTVNGLASGTTYYWKVVAHASCDPARTSETIGSFATLGSCGGAAPLTLTTPNDGDGTVPAAATLSWAPSVGAASYDLYLGSGSNPPLYLTGVEKTSVVVPGLSAGAGYSWKVVANAACDATMSSTSAVRHFTVAACGSPSVPQNLLAPQTALAPGATYTLRWSDAVGLDAGGSYLVERATDAAFSNVVDHQQTIATSASFVTKSAGTYYHRVRSIAGCDTTKRSAPSESAQVTVNATTPMVVFSMLPQAVITKLGDKIEDQKTSFALENLGTTPVQVLVGPQLTGSVPFFTIVDPFGGDAAFVTLEPRKPKSLDIHYSGPPNDQPGTYQGGIYVVSTGQPLAFTPQAYVNLKVGGDANAAAPKLLVNGIESELAYFPPVTGDDSARPAVQVDLLNSGSVAMEVAGEIGPEAWLRMEKDWNALAVPASGFRTLRLSTQRTKAVAGSALPRYTYLTVRNKAGQAARLLVEDSGGITSTTGRSAPLDTGGMSAIVPFVASGTAIIVTNSGSDVVPVDLVYTPEGADGFDPAAVLRASIVIPPNDMVTLSDPLVQIFAKDGNAAGAIEIVSAKLAQLAIRAEARKPASGGGAYTAVIPVAMRGEGARLDSVYRVSGITSTADTKTTLIVTETSGREKTTVHITLSDASGTKRGEQTIELGRYGTKRIDDLAQALAGGAAFSGGGVGLEVTSGGGAVLSTALVTDRTSGAGAAMVGRAIAIETHLSSLGRPIATTAVVGSTLLKLIVPGVVTDGKVKTTIGVSATSGSVNATITFRDSGSGQTTKQTLTIGGGQTSEYDLPAGKGTVTVQTDAPAAVYARVRGTNIADVLPVVSPLSEGLTGGGSAIPLYADGLEHSIDPTRGRKTSLILTELAGQSATVNVRLYEPGSRTAAVAERDFTIGANGELRLDNLFVSMGLESGPDDRDQRRKNQVNVAVVVTATSGTGVIAAQAVLTDYRTGDRRTIQLLPVGGVPATALQRGLGTTSAPPRRRAVAR